MGRGPARVPPGQPSRDRRILLTDLPPQFYIRGGARSWARFTFQGSSNLAALPPPALAPSREVGFTLACRYAYLPAFEGGCLVSIYGVIASFLLLPVFWVGVLNVPLSIGFRFRGTGQGALPHRTRRGAYVPIFPPPRVHFPHPCRFALSLSGACIHTL